MPILFLWAWGFFRIEDLAGKESLVFWCVSLRCAGQARKRRSGHSLADVSDILSSFNGYSFIFLWWTVHAKGVVLCERTCFCLLGTF